MTYPTEEARAAAKRASVIKYRKRWRDRVARAKGEELTAIVAKRLFIGVRSRAKIAGLPFNLEPQDVVIPERCPVLGIPLRVDKSHSDVLASVDRVIPEKGYVKGNIVVVSLRANRIKNNATAAELRALADFYTKLEQQCQANT